VRHLFLYLITVIENKVRCAISTSAFITLIYAIMRHTILHRIMITW